MTTQVKEPEYDIIDPATDKPVEEKGAKPSKAEPKPEPTKEYTIPEKFKGKSPEEIAKAYEEQEKLLGRQGQELGEMRKQHQEMQRQVNDIIQRELEQSKSRSEAEDMEAELGYGDLVDNPTDSIKRVVNPEIDALKKELQSMKSQTAQEKFVAKHPDFLDIDNSQEFQSWVANSPYRQRAYMAAAQGDLEAADDLLSGYKEVHSLQETADNSKREAALKGASTESGSATGTVKQKRYRRSDLIKLRLEDPDGYRSRSEEFMRAYQEGRVINDID